VLSTSQIDFLDKGLVRYDHGLQLQEMAKDRLAQSGVSSVILLEHPSVVTMGRNGSESFLLEDEEYLKQKGIELFKSDRGGEVTGHEPGQLVVYPILPLSWFKDSVRLYVSFIEDTVISVLSQFKLDSSRDDKFPGVWVGKSKICAVGIRVKNKVTSHGIALNVSNSLNVFKCIVPCGIQGRGVTSISSELKEIVDIGEVKRVFIQEFRSRITHIRKAADVSAPSGVS
jgi:lipoate-protein ligase B